MREIIYRPVPGVKCPDGKLRTARARSTIYSKGLHPDTAFSVPAYVQVSGRTVSGFIAPADGLAFQQEHGPELEFTPWSGRRNHNVFPKPG